MANRRRGGAVGGGRSPMERAARGLEVSGEALTAMYNAAAQVLPEVLERVDRGLDLYERAVVAAEASAHARVELAGGWRCQGCGGYHLGDVARTVCDTCKAARDAG